MLKMSKNKQKVNLTIATVKAPIYDLFNKYVYYYKYEEKLTIILNIKFLIRNHSKLLMTFWYLK